MSQDGRADTVVVIDFETTGLSPDRGDRAIEIGAVRLQDGRIHDRFQCLMNPGRRISPPLPTTPAAGTGGTPPARAGR